MTNIDHESTLNNFIRVTLNVVEDDKTGIFVAITGWLIAFIHKYVGLVNDLTMIAAFVLTVIMVFVQLRKLALEDKTEEAKDLEIRLLKKQLKQVEKEGRTPPDDD
jgi:hypothetical protein